MPINNDNTATLFCIHLITGNSYLAVNVKLMFFRSIGNNTFIFQMGLIYSKITRSTKMASSPEIQKFIKEAVSQEKVVVFSKSYCPYCTMAKEASLLFFCLY